jgi:hypothetical protein
MIINMLGSVVQAPQMNSHTRTINIASLPSGRYTMLVTEEGVTQAASFVLTK